MIFDNEKELLKVMIDRIKKDWEDASCESEHMNIIVDAYVKLKKVVFPRDDYS